MISDAETPVVANGIIINRNRSEKVRVLRILIADESREFRKFIRRQFEAEADFDVIGEVLSGSDLLPQVRQLKPDVVLVDIALSGMAGLEGTRRLKAEIPSTRVIFLSIVDEEALRDAAARYGADDFLTKGLPISEMFAHIRRRAAKAMPRGY
ncbi:MAG: response regulator transcription factor [Candidatus Acidiferrales bacterium]